MAPRQKCLGGWLPGHGGQGWKQLLCCRVMALLPVTSAGLSACCHGQDRQPMPVTISKELTAGRSKLPWRLATRPWHLWDCPLLQLHYITMFSKSTDVIVQHHHRHSRIGRLAGEGCPGGWPPGHGLCALAQGCGQDGAHPGAEGPAGWGDRPVRLLGGGSVRIPGQGRQEVAQQVPELGL